MHCERGKKDEREDEGSAFIVSSVLFSLALTFPHVGCAPSHLDFLFRQVRQAEAVKMGVHGSGEKVRRTESGGRESQLSIPCA